MTVFKNHLSGPDTDGRREQLASVTLQQPNINQVSDGMKIYGQLSDQLAELSLELTKAHDCQENQFSCVAIFIDNEDKNSMKKSLVGNVIDSHPDFETHTKPAKMSVTPLKVFSSDGSSALILVNLINSLMLKFDKVESRLEDALKALENRLEDKVSDLRATINDKTGVLDSSIEGKVRALSVGMNDLEHRLGEKLEKYYTHIVGGSSQPTKNNIDNLGGICTQLASKLEGLETKLINNTKLLESCEMEVEKQTKTTNLFDQLATFNHALQSIEKNLTCFNQSIDQTKLLVNQLVQRASTEDPTLTNIASHVTSLFNLTQNLSTQINGFREDYASGALVPVEEFSDPLGTGKKEWRLAFRGTAYNDIQVYPAYMHGTGIPIEVEEGCKQFNNSLPCVNHYRNKAAFDNWAGIDEILFALFKENQIVRKIIFNGKDSTYTDWFAASRVIQSSWVDLITQPHNFFSIKGFYTQPGHVRRWYVNLDHNKGCNGFRGWFYVRDIISGGCTPDVTDARPLFQYAAGNTFTVWTSQNFDRADAFGIFLKYE